MNVLLLLCGVAGVFAIVHQPHQHNGVDVVGEEVVIAKPQEQQQLPLYKNKLAPINERVQDLVSRMTVEEKVAQLLHPWTAGNNTGVCGRSRGGVER